ncbi:MAG: carboxypeptidase regulatory-like domain-containing protein [Elusimicrobia bacterium]|nr:carboxypeptidase regulatory-like domain-containing protein [Elusimicrobiota bacterium]
MNYKKILFFLLICGVLGYSGLNAASYTIDVDTNGYDFSEKASAEWMSGADIIFSSGTYTEGIVELEVSNGDIVDLGAVPLNSISLFTNTGSGSNHLQPDVGSCYTFLTEEGKETAIEITSIAASSASITFNYRYDYIHSISGSLDYAGAHTGDILIALWDNPQLEDEPVYMSTMTGGGYPVDYHISGLVHKATYYIAALINEDVYQGPEYLEVKSTDPWAVYDSTDAETNIVGVVVSSAGVNMTLIDGTIDHPNPFFQEDYELEIFSSHRKFVDNQQKYFVEIILIDRDAKASSVTVSGYGVSGEMELDYEDYGERKWATWASSSTEIGGWYSPPTPPLYYTIKVYDGGEPLVYESTVTAFMSALPADLSPASGEYLTVEPGSYTWSSVAGADNYWFRLTDRGTNNNMFSQLHEAGNLSVTYVASSVALAAGHHYEYTVTAEDIDGNESSTDAEFKYLVAPQPNNLNPMNIMQGDYQKYVDIFGNFFSSEAVVSIFSDTDTVVESYMWSSNSHIQMYVSVLSSAPTGSRTVRVTNPGGVYNDILIYVQQSGGNTGAATQLHTFAEPNNLEVNSTTTLKAIIKDDMWYTVNDATNAVTFMRTSGDGNFVGESDTTTAVTVNAVNGVAFYYYLAPSTTGYVDFTVTSPGLVNNFIYLSVFGEGESANFGTISGDVSYNGSYAGSTEPIKIQVFNNPQFNPPAAASIQIPQTGPFQINNAPADTYLYVRAYKDLNSNGLFDSNSEPSGVYTMYNSTEPQSIWLNSYGYVSNVYINMNDAGVTQSDMYMNYVSPYQITKGTYNYSVFVHVYGDFKTDASTDTTFSFSPSIQIQSKNVISQTHIELKLNIVSSLLNGYYNLNLEDNRGNYADKTLFGAIQIIDSSSAGSASMLGCYSDSYSLPGDGVSQTTVKAEIQDNNCNRIYGATNTVTFSISGPGYLVGTNPVPASDGVATINVKAGTAYNMNLEIKAESPGLSDGYAYISLYSSSTGSSFATITGNVNYYGQYSGASGSIYVMLSSASSIPQNLDVTSDTSTIKAYIKAASDRSYYISNAPVNETLYLLCFKDLNSNKKYDSSSEPAGFLPYPNNMSVPEPLIFYSGDIRYYSFFMSDPGEDSFTAQVYDIQPYSFLLPASDTTYYFTVYGSGFYSADTVELKSPSGSLDVTSTSYISSTSLMGSLLLSTYDYPGSYDVVIKSSMSVAKAVAPGMMYINDNNYYGSGIPTQILCWSDMYSMAADTAVTTVVHAEIVDANYNRVTTAADKITFSVSGAMDIASSNPVWASYGEASVTVRAKSTPDSAIRITASAQGLVSGTADLNTYDPGSGLTYGSIEGNVYYSGSKTGTKYIKAAKAYSPQNTWYDIDEITYTAKLSEVSDGLKNELALQALRMKIKGDVDASTDVVNQLITGFPHGGWKGSAAADSYGHYRINNALANRDLMVFSFLDRNGDGGFTEDISVSTNTEPYGYFRYFGTTGEYPAVVWLISGGFINFIDIDVKDPSAVGTTISMQVYGIDPPSALQGQPGQAPLSKDVYVYGNGFVPGMQLSFYPSSPPITVDNPVTFIDKYSFKATVHISSDVYAGAYDVIVTTGNSSAKAYDIFHINSSIGSNSISGEVNYPDFSVDGSSGTIYAGLFKGASYDDEMFRYAYSVGDPTTSYSYSFTGLPDGIYSVYALMDTDGTGLTLEPHEPSGMYPYNPVYIYGGQSIQDADFQVFKQNFDKPYLSGANPYSAAKGSSGVSVAVFGGNLQDTGIINFGPGVTVATFTAHEYEIVAEIDISASAYTGDRTISVTDAQGYVTSVRGIFRITDTGTCGSGEIKGSVSYVDPSGTGSGTKNGNIVVAVWAGGVFQGPPLEETYSSYVASAPSNINYQIPGLASNNYSIFSFVDINMDMMPDINEPQTVYQFNPVKVTDGQTTRVDMTVYDIYSSTSAGQVTIDYISPKYVMAGTTDTVSIFAQGVQPGAEVQFGQGITISSTSLIYDSTAAVIGLEADLDISATSLEGFRNVRILNQDGTSGIGLNKLVVTPAVSGQDAAVGNGSISGTLYNNSGSTGTYMVALWDGYIFNGPPLKMKEVPAKAGVALATYSITGLADSGRYYLGVYIDTNDNNMPDHIPGVIEEPEQVYGSFDSPKAIMVSNGAAVKNVNLTFRQPSTIDVKEFMPSTVIAGSQDFDILVFGYGFSSGINNSHINITTTSITLNSVKYIDFSQIALNVDIAAGVSGTCKISVTNPSDSMMSTGTLRIAGSQAAMTAQTGEVPFDVTVKDGSGNNIQGALVGAVSFDQFSYEPDAVISRAGYTKSDGKCRLFLQQGYDYIIAAGKHDYEPSVKVQMTDPWNYPVPATAGSKTITLRERPDPSVAQEYEKVGMIEGKIFNVRLSGTPRVLLMSVDNMLTGEPANFAMVPAAAKTLYYSIGNIQTAKKTNIYKVSVFDPVFGIGTSEVVGSTVGVGGAVEIDLDFEDVETLSSSGGADDADEDAAFTGYVYEDKNSNGSYDYGEGIENARVTFRSYAYNENDYNPGIESPVEVVTDYNGKYILYDLPLYNADPNYVGPKGGYPNNNTYGVSVFAEEYNGMEDYYGSDTGKYSDYERTYQGWKKTLNYPLTTASGSISGYVYLGSTDTLISADVNIWPDHRSYGGIPSDPGLSHGHVSSFDGSFTISGLSNGNYSLEIWSEFSQNGYMYNNGEDGQYESNDDLRVTVSDGNFAVYQVTSGVKIADQANPIRIILEKEDAQGQEDCAINGRVTLLKSGMDLSGTMIVAREDWNSIPEWDVNEWGNKRAPRVSYIDLSTYTANPIDYTIKVPTGTYYVKINSSRNGVLGECEYRASFESTGTVRNRIDFKIAHAGKIKGVVRKPDGRLYKPDTENGEWMCMQAEGDNVQCRSWADVTGEGQYMINGLLPGTYMLRPNFSDDDLDYSRKVIKNIIVEYGETTVVNYRFSKGQELVLNVPQISSSVVSSIREEGTGSLCTNLSVIAVDPGEKFVMADMVLDAGQDDSSSCAYIDWGTMNQSTSEWKWSKLMLEYGTYDLYLVYFGSIMNSWGDNEDFYWCNKTPFGTILDKKTGVSLSTEPVTLNYSRGNYSVKGKAAGKYFFKEDDVKKASSNFDYFIDLIPRITILDSAGVQKAAGAIVPVLTLDGGKYGGVEFLEEWIAKADVASIQNYFDDINNCQYIIKGLPSGSYTLVATSKNYAPIVRKITVSGADVVQDLDFDALAAVSGRISGNVKVKNSTETIAGATLMLYVGKEEKQATTDTNGNYIFEGLLAGIYKIKVTAPGYGFREDKVEVKKGKNTTKNFEFEYVVRSKLTGTVYKQKMPYPRVYEGAEVVLLDQTEQESSVKKVATKQETVTDENGVYAFMDLASGHVYKLYVMAEGYRLSQYTVSKATYTETQDIVLQPDPPRMSIYQGRDASSNINFYIESNKTLVSKPKVVFTQGFSIDISSYVAEGAEKIYTLTVNNTAGAGTLDKGDLSAAGFDLSKDITMTVTGTDGSREGVGTAVFNISKAQIKVRLIISNIIAVGGDVAIDISGDDLTKITINPGALTITGSTVTPSMNLDRHTAADDGSIGKEEKGLTASDIYLVDIVNAILSGESPLTFTFDYDETKDTETVTVCYYDPQSGKWLPIKATITKDPVTGTLEIDFNAQDITTESGKSLLSFAPYVQGKGYDPSRAKPVKIKTILSGLKFAVFTQEPTYAIPDEQGEEESNARYTGDEFRIYNFPNPFDLEDKTVTLENTGTNSSLKGDKTVSGTVLKYYYPEKYGDDATIRFYIYNIAGEFVRTIVEPVREGGYIYFSEWDGLNDEGEKCASGIYLMFSYVDDELVVDEAHKMAIVK